MNRLFKKKTDSDRKSVRYEIRMTKAESESIQTAARVRCIPVSELMLKAALGRRADVKFDTEVVLAIREVVQVVRQLHSQFAMQQIPPPPDLLELLIDEAVSALQRISK